ncbi:MAG: TlpA family protein disulfide reductase [Marinifilum sp.]|jgi:thiol-disulfide isomerase/thioredoxin|nr:TlpA family protein disulfide reductase [Marinifilum sp.]
MKKIILTALVLLTLTIVSFSQGINFEHGNWASVKAKAKQENKIIFIDFYTSWCGPCKMLSKNVFPQKAVGDFYNKHFINYKIDAEKGEGPKLVQKFGVKAYPTLIFSDSNGEFLHQGIGGMQADALIELGKAAMNPDKQLGKLLKENSDDIKDMPAHLRKLKRERLPLNDKYETYISSLSKKELLTPSTFDLMVELGGKKATGFTFDLILKNKEAFTAALGNKKVDDYFYNKYLYSVHTSGSKKEILESIYKEIKGNGFDFSEKIKETVLLTRYTYKEEHDKFLQEAPKYIEKYTKNDPELKYKNVFMMACKHANKNEKLKAYALQLAEELINADYKVASVNMYLGKSCAEAGELKQALSYYQKASDYSKKNGLKDEYAKSVEYLKKQIKFNELGDYTFNIQGLDKYNGLDFKLFYYSDIEIGEMKESAPVKIVDGKCCIKGKVNTPMAAGWAIYDGDYMKKRGNIILEPGEFKVVLMDKDLTVKNGKYNHYAYQRLRDYPSYKKSVKNLEDYKSKDIDYNNRVVRVELSKLHEAIANSKKEYYTLIYTKNADPKVRMLVFYIGNLWGKKNAPDGEIEKLKAELGDHYLLKTIARFNDDSKKRKEMKATVVAGKQIKPFVARDLNGKEFSLEKILKKNKYVLVEFWASWCKPCRALIPHLKQTYKQYRKKGFEIVSFSLDKKGNLWRNASEKEEIPWINTSDLKGMKSPIVKMYGVNGIPDSFLVDRDGKIVGSHLKGEKLDKALEELFK